MDAPETGLIPVSFGAAVVNQTIFGYLYELITMAIKIGKK